MEASSDSGSHVGSVVQVCFPSVRTAVLDSLNQQRLEGRLCDLSIQVQRQVFRAHRCVLAASSPYFHDQVLLKNVTTVSLPSVMDPVAFESVLSSAYTGQLSILRDDIVNYVTVASFLQMWHIVDKCTEILKRPRASAEPVQGDSAPGASYPAASSRQQSPSSTDCLYVEREASRKDRRTDALPPLATWRRPQQFPRCGRPRPSAHPADSQLVGPGGESDYSSCDEVWMSSSKAFSHDGRGGRQDYGHPSTRPQGELPGEGLRLRARPRQRDPPPGSDRLSGRDPPPGSDRLNGRERGRGEGGGGFEGESQEKKRNERWIEADEGIGEVEAEKSVWSHRTGHPGDFSMTVPQGGEGQAEAKVNPDASLKKEEREQPRGGGAPAGPLGPLSPSSTPSHRVPWQAGSWSQQGAKQQDRPEVDEDEEEEEEVDFGRFADGAFGGDTYDEIEDGTGQVSQRPLLPASPDNSEFNLGGPEMDWPSSNMGQPGPSNPPSNQHLSSSSSAMFPPSLSPPTPHTGGPYRGKVHFCHCGKAYTLKSMRDRHVKMQHLNLRPFGCLVCAKTFKMKHHLTKHLKTHGGLRPYECRLCGKKVIWRDSFLRHQARCERLTASYGDVTSACNNAGPSGEMDYGFEEGQGFLAEGGQVKVEETDFQGEVEAGVSGLMGGGVAGVDALGQDSGE